ncbi:septum site-determining protein MinC [Limnochorda pilosa]|uniref:Probable septum site-determining protein MinC n=1 Tax=Limnochorda pilosa TaxID=1555112 RepID=A0A0K2SNC7_LIMPI|nr:septum site-determining protein MinC [Limnochorda pilosa]BAS28615.1 septum site-determining protein MinC [Limnochorda pilosa]
MRFKGGKDGVYILFDETVDFSEALAELRRRLGLYQRFFEGGRVWIETGSRELSPLERRLVEEAASEFGMDVGEVSSQRGRAQGSRAVAALPARRAPAQAEAEPTLLVRGPLRSGRAVEFDGNVVVLGDLNPGAVVRSTGDVIVLGHLRGVVHAGAGGNQKAQVWALRLEPTQLRIADRIARPPDDEHGPGGPEVARIVGEWIQVEAYEPGAQGGG